MSIQDWFRFKKIELFTLSAVALSVRILKYLLAVISVGGFLYQLPEMTDSIDQLVLGKTALWSFFLANGALFTTIIATTIVSFAEGFWIRGDALRNYNEIDILKTPFGVQLIEALVAGLNEPERIQVYAQESGWYNPRLNEALLKASLLNKNITFKIIPEDWHAYDPRAISSEPRQQEKKRFAIQRKLRDGVSFSVNDRKVRLYNDLSSDLSNTVSLGPTDYISSLMTDQLAFRKITAKDDDKFDLHDGFSDFIQKNGRLYRLLSLLETKNVSNQLGVSTLAFTNDGMLILVKQTIKNSQSPGRLAPSGSGSLSWDDVLAGDSQNLLSVVKHGAARELIEECGLTSHVDLAAFAKSHLLIYGFTRMIHRAGKPEFFCIAALPFSSEEMKKMKVSNEERLFSERILLAAMPRLEWNENLCRQISVVCRFYSNPENLQQNAQGIQALRLSYPLHHGLDMLADLCDTCPDAAQKLADFLRNPTKQKAVTPKLSH